MTTVFVLMDAFRSDYIDRGRTPFLKNCADSSQYYKRVKPSIGFCERSEIVTGRPSLDLGFLTAIKKDAASSPFKNCRLLSKLGKVEELSARWLPVSANEISARILRRLARQIARSQKIRMGMYKIPLRDLNKFALSEDAFDHTTANAFSVPSLFDIVRLHGLRSWTESYTSMSNVVQFGNDADRLSHLCNAIRMNESDLYMLYIGALDTIGHSHGPNSKQLNGTLSMLDQQMKFLYDVTRESFKRFRIVFLGDHGMDEVTNCFDVKSALDLIFKQIGLVEGRDYLIFLDSTMVRIWFLSKEARQSSEEAVIGCDDMNAKGQFVHLDRKRKKLPVTIRRQYGDMIWLADRGTLVLPNYFQGNKGVRGMHGYLPDEKSSQGMCMQVGNGIKQSETELIELHQVFDILKESIEL